MADTQEFLGPEWLRGPQIDEGRLKDGIWREVRMAADMITTEASAYDPLVTNEEWNVSHPVERHLAGSFMRARAILQIIGTGLGDWRTNSMPVVRVDDDAFQGLDPITSESIKANTLVLIELIALSRIELKPDPHNPSGQTPLLEDVELELARMRQELGVADEYDQQMRDFNRPTGAFPPTFPGVNDKAIVQAIASGRLRVGLP